MSRPRKEFLKGLNDDQEINTTARRIFMPCSSEHFTLKLLFYYLSIKIFISFLQQPCWEIHLYSVALKKFLFKITWVGENLSHLFGCSDNNTSLGLPDIKMRRSSTPEFRGTHEVSSLLPLTSVDFVISNKQRVHF